MKKAFVMTVVLLAGCASHIDMVKITPEETIYFREVQQFPMSFWISKADLEFSWARAQSFIAQFSPEKINTLSDHVIQTNFPREGIKGFGYTVSSVPEGDSIRITVECKYGNKFQKEDAANNSRILAYYIKTGELFPRLIAK